MKNVIVTVNSRFLPLLIKFVAVACVVLPLQAIDLGFIYDQFPLTLQQGERTEMLGPLVSWQKTTNETGWTFSPLMSYRKIPNVEHKSFDFLYPLVTHDRYGTEYRFHIGQVFSISGGNNQKQEQKKRFTLFPVYFQQRGPNPEDNYTAVLPFYGTLRNRIFRDRVDWVMFPFYVTSDKRDVHTKNYLLPLFHVRTGNGLNGKQFWPIVGKEHKTLTTRTNGFGDVEQIGGHDKFFLLWPLHFKNDLGIGTTNQESQRVYLPFYAQIKSPARETTAYGFPIGYTKIINRELKYEEWGAPWPLVTFAKGEGKTATRIFPFYGSAKNPTLQSDFVLWPIYKYNAAHTEALDRERTRILFFLYSDTMERNVTTKAFRRRTTLLPFYTRYRDLEGNTRFQVLSLLETFFPGNASIERNYSPIWSLWRSERSAKTGDESDSLLWNLYRREKNEKGRKVSFLFGLFQYRADEDGKHLRFFYIPVK